MPPTPKRDFGVILFDVASPQKAELLNGLIKFCTFKWFTNSKSVYRVILVNTALTSNDKDYSNIYTSKVNDFDPKLLAEEILNVNLEVGKANWLDAVLLALSYLKEASTFDGVVTPQLIFFTTLEGDNTPPLDQAKIGTIVKNANRHGIFLYIIGPNVQLPYVITSFNAVKKCMKELVVDEQNSNFAIAKEIVDGVNESVMCNCKIGIHLLMCFKNSPGTQLWKVPLAIGTKFSIAASTARIYRKDISLKLASSRATMRSCTKVLADDRNVVVNDSDIAKGIERHGKFVPIEESMFKAQTERCFNIIGFIDKKDAPETYLLGDDMFYVLPSENDFHLFTHLLNVLSESDKYAIVKRVYAKNTKTGYFFLIPNVDHTPKCFTMTQMPFGDHLKQHKCDVPIPRSKIDDDDDFSNYFQSLIIDNKECKSGVVIGPTMMMDFHQQELTNAIAKKYIELPDLDMASLGVNYHQNEEYNEFLEKLKRSWPDSS